MLVLVIALVISLACSFSTAKLSDLKIGKDKDATSTTGTFNPDDTIFAVSGVDYGVGKTTVKFRLLIDKVEGGQPGNVAYQIENSLAVDGSRPVWFTMSVPGGFAPGTYKAEVVLNSEDGKELDRKSGTFTISGTSSKKNTAPEAKSTDSTADEDSEEK